MAGIKKASVTEVFNGQSGIYIFDEVPDYNSATFATITAGGFDVGQVLEGTTEWTGEEPTLEARRDEKGGVIVSNPTAGTFGFAFSMADYSADKFQTFMRGRKISSLTAGAALEGVTEAIGIGAELPVIERPVALANDTSDKIMFFPKARIVTGPSIDDGLWLLTATVEAQQIETADLDTMMLIPKGNIKFEED